MAAQLISTLPRYMHILALDSSRRFLTLANFGGLLTFSSAEPSHLTVHECRRISEQSSVFMIRSQNGKFWRRETDDFIVADLDTMDEAIYFRALQLPNKVTVLQTIDDQLYLKRFDGRIDGYRAYTPNIDIHSQMLVVAADDMIVTLPHKLALLALDDSRRFLARPSTGGGAVTFSVDAMSSLTIHEVVESIMDDGTVMIRTPDGMFWRRRSDGYIIADREGTPGTSDKESYFKAVRFQNVTVFQSVVDGRYLKRFTNGSISNGYNAATDSIDSHCQMLVIAVDDESAFK